MHDKCHIVVGKLTWKKVRVHRFMQTPVWQWQISEDEFRIRIHLFKPATHTTATIINCHKLSSLHSTPIILCIDEFQTDHNLHENSYFQSGMWIRGVLAVLVLHYLLCDSPPFQNLQAILPVSRWPLPSLFTTLGTPLVFDHANCNLYYQQLCTQLTAWLLDCLIWLLDCLSIILSTLCLVLFGVLLLVLLDNQSCTILIIAISHSVLLCCAAYLNSLEYIRAATYLEYQPS